VDVLRASGCHRELNAGSVEQITRWLAMRYAACSRYLLPILTPHMRARLGGADFAPGKVPLIHIVVHTGKCFSVSENLPITMKRDSGALHLRCR
jgi:hypothetical protein